MVDCGEGTQRQLLRSGAGFRRLDRLLLTHAHLDLVLGIPGLFSTLRLRQSAVMTIHGSPTTLDVVVRMLAGLWGEGRALIPLQLVPLAEGRILDAGEFTVDGFPVRHRDTESFAFSFESQVRRHLLPDRLSAPGVPDGAVRKDLAEGRSVALPDGRRLGPPEGRKKLVVVGDTQATDGLAEHVRDADLLVIEATFLERDAAMALDYGHLTAAKAAELAAIAGVILLEPCRVGMPGFQDDVAANKPHLAHKAISPGKSSKIEGRIEVVLAGKLHDAPEKSPMIGGFVRAGWGRMAPNLVKLSHGRQYAPAARSEA
jgi:ribonuclease Z